jgi:hypothetical protein
MYLGGKAPRRLQGHPDELLVLAAPRQVVMFDGAMYHRGVANTSTPHPEGKATRRVCLMCYQVSLHL